MADVEAFVARVLAATVTETPGVALGTELHFGDGPLTGTGLSWEGAVVHTAGFETAGRVAPPPSRPIRRRR